MKTKMPQFESLDQMAGATAGGLVQLAAHSAFQLFWDKNFRQLASLEILSQVEQDRIFNELVAAYLVLILLILEAPDLRVSRDFRDYLRGLQEKIPGAYLDYMRTLGVQSEHMRQWEELIGLRYDEYARDRHEVRAAAMQIESSEKALDLEDLSKIQMLVPVQTVAIGSHHHICRGETGGRDDLFKATLKSLSRFYVDIRLQLEVGKITPLKRARVAWQRMIHRRKRKKK